MNKSEISIRWHSRAGQGAVTAANFLAEAMEHFYKGSQSFPDYGAEKRGAPVMVYNKFSNLNKRINDPAHIKNPDIVVLLDPTLVGNELVHADVLKGLSDDGILVINTTKKKSKFNDLFKGTIYHLNASEIAMKTVGRNVPNVPMIGGLTNILNISVESMQSILNIHLSSFFGSQIVEKNMVGYRESFENIYKS